MTAKEVSRIAKVEIDNVIMKLVAEYGMDKVNSYTVSETMRNEIGKALYELETQGKILTNKERWC